jgi:hypothetical protein
MPVKMAISLEVSGDIAISVSNAPKKISTNPIASR